MRASEYHGEGHGNSEKRKGDIRRPARGGSRRPFLDPNRISEECLRLASSHNRKSRRSDNMGVVLGGPGVEVLEYEVATLPLIETGSVLRSTVGLKFSFDWCEERFNVLKYFEAKLPHQIQENADVIELGQYSPPARGTKRIRREEWSSDISAERIEALPLPKHYYTPWPTLTHKLPFPGNFSYKVAERAVATLNDYLVQRQSDDSIELGLRITAHVHMKDTNLTVHPVTRVWGILRGREGENLDVNTAADVAVVNDLQRRLCPYMPVTMGKSRALVTMMIYCEHWWVLLLTGADIVIDMVVDKVSCVSNSIDDGYIEASEVMDAYAKSFDNVVCDGVALCAIDSLHAVIPLQGWCNVKKYVFISIYHSLTCRLTAEGEATGMGKVAVYDTANQILHLACASFQAVECILWNRRVHMGGPRQPDDVSCGAYGLATVWKLANEGGLLEIEGVIRNTLKVHCDKEYVPERTVHSMYIQRYYDSHYVAFVVREIDRFVRKEVIPCARNSESITKLD